MRLISLIALLFGLLSPAGSSAQATPYGQMVDYSLSWDGQARTYYEYLPPCLADERDRHAVMMLHGRGGAGSGMARMTQLIPIAERECFIALFPETNSRRGWNNGIPARARGGDDVGYLRAVVSDVVRRDGLDPAHVYVAGMSSGAIMALRLVCEAPDLIAAAGVVAGLLPMALQDGCRPGEATPVVMVNGTADGTVPFDGSRTFLSQAATRALLAAQFGCTAQTPPMMLPDPVNDGTSGILERMAGCAGLDLYVIQNGGHNWPGSPVGGTGRKSQDINATEILVSFFQGQGL